MELAGSGGVSVIDLGGRGGVCGTECFLGLFLVFFAGRVEDAFAAVLLKEFGMLMCGKRSGKMDGGCECAGNRLDHPWGKGVIIHSGKGWVSIDHYEKCRG